MSDFAVLIVEDTPHYQDIYARAVERQKGLPVIAHTLERAVMAVKQRAFPVAIVDIRLADRDEKNEDGLKVLQFIRKMADGTNAIVITGYGSMKIGWEAHLNSAFATFSKADVALSAIEEAISKAAQKYKRPFPSEKTRYSEALKERLDRSWAWEDRVLRTCAPKGGADGLYRFLGDFLPDLSPLLQYEPKQGCRIVEDRKLAIGIFWSRQIGQPILLAFGRTKPESDQLDAELVRSFPGIFKLGPSVKETSSNGMYGVARVLQDQGFDSFEQP
jgi:ActR/RegA family two-component response regulator